MQTSGSGIPLSSLPKTLSVAVRWQFDGSEGMETDQLGKAIRNSSLIRLAGLSLFLYQDLELFDLPMQDNQVSKWDETQ
jgi:hypothetical protein